MKANISGKIGNLLPVGKPRVVTTTEGVLESTTFSDLYKASKEEEHIQVEIPFSDYLQNSTKNVPGHYAGVPRRCVSTFIVYPTKELQVDYHSKTASDELAVATAFYLVVLTFLGYDCFVRRRNHRLLAPPLEQLCRLAFLRAS
jgi:hypothetical protein